MTCARSRFSVFALFVSQALTLVACGGGDSDEPVAPVKLPASLAVGNGAPEDIVSYGAYAYVSNLNDGSVLRLDLAKGGSSSTWIPASTDAYRSAWGLRVLPSRNWLLSIQNIPYDFNPAHAQAGRVTAFDLSTGVKLRSWDLPAQAVGNSIDVDQLGNIYVGDIGPNTRILKIDPVSNAVTTWATDARWLTNGFGVGGMVFNGAGFYASHNNLLWYIGINPDGTSATPAAVNIDGNPAIFADGMTWTNGGIDYANNDLYVPGAQGAVYRIQFNGLTTATRSVIQSGLFDPSGVTTAAVGGHSYLLVNESKLGYAVGTETGQPSLPYQVKVFPL